MLKGGAWYYEATYLRSAARQSYPSKTRLNVVGFRVGAVIPEPATGVLMMTGILGLAAWRKRRT